VIEQKCEQIKMEYEGLTEIDKEIPTRGEYTRVALQAITDFQNKNMKTAKLDITDSSQQELKALYNALKSLIRRRKIPVRATMQKEKATSGREIYLIKGSP
jgi:hypothetical protein